MYRWYGVAVSAMMLVSLIAVPATAQAEGTLYLDGLGNAAGTTSAIYGIKTADEIPAQDKAYFPITSMGGTYPAYYDFVAPYDFTPGQFDYAFTAGCDSVAVAAPAGAATTMRIEVMDGGTVLAQSIPASVSTTCTGGTFPVAGSINVGEKVFLEGSTMRLRVYAWFSTVPGEDTGLYIVTGETATLTGATLPTGLVPPVLEELPSVVYENLTVPSFNHAFANATSDRYVFNFTSEHGFGLVDLAVNGTGFANATLLDGNATEVLNGTLGSGLTEYQNFTAGNWTLRLAYADFNGTLDFAFLDGETLQMDAPTADHNHTMAHNETVLAEPADDAESPGVALPVMAISLVAAAVLGRRRP